MKNYIPLHVQSHYSILQAVPTVDELVEQAKRFGLSSFALTDRNNMFGVPEFGKAMKKAGMKPIFGIKVDLTEGSRFSSFRQTKDQSEKTPPNTLVLLAQTDEGYRNLLKLVSAGYKDASFGRFKVDKNLIEEYNKGVIVLSSDDTGLIRQLANYKNIQRLDEELTYFRDLLGKDRFFLELHDGGSTNDKIVNKLLLEKAAEFDLNYVASNTVRMINPHDRILCDIVCAIRDGDTISKMTARSDYDSLLPSNALEQTNYVGHEYFKSPQEMEELFRDLPLALENTVKISEMCEDIAFQAKGDQSPQFPIPQGYNAETFLREKAFKALESKFPQGVPQKYTDRLQFELDIVCKMGFPNYFLVVGDFVGFARKNGIFVGPGRGSAAGALLSYVLGITNIDPLPYDLIFERFLNPERVSMPDIDSDFEDERRDEVKEYLRSTYGMDKTADVITFGYNKAKAVLKDVGRVLEIPLTEVNRVSGLIGRQEVDEDLGEVLKSNKGLQEAAERSSSTRLWIEFSSLLCGRIRNLGKHASAVIVAGRPIEQIVPLTRDKKNTVTTQFEGGYLEENGLLKMDILGLANLGIIRDCLLRIRKERSKIIDIDTIPQDDPNVFKLFTDGRTAGLFQFESDKMTEYLRQLRPNNIEDLIAMNALYRPGPMDNIPSFIKRKNGEEPIDCFHPSLEPILKPTYGIIVYQEQVMQIAQVLSGFSLGEADNVRRIMAKKKPEELEKIHTPWIEGALKQGYPEELAQTLFDLLIPFSNYAFNKSHAASYSVLAYQTAWLKTNYTAEYMASLMSFNINKDDVIAKYIEEARVIGIPVLPPDINKSGAVFELEKNSEGRTCIRYGLSALKGIGDSVAIQIIAERKMGGAFTSITDFIERTYQNQAIRKASLEILICIGAFDQFLDSENLLQEKAIYLHQQNLDSLYRKFEKETSSEISLFSTEEIVAASGDGLTRNVPSRTEEEEYADEIRIFGFSFAGRLFDTVFEKYGKYSSYKETLKEILVPGTPVCMMGHVTQIEEISGARGNWGRVSLSTEKEKFSYTLFQDKWERFKNSDIKEKAFLYVRARINEFQRKDGTISRSYDILDFCKLNEKTPLISELHIFIDQTELSPDLTDVLSQIKARAKKEYLEQARITLKLYLPCKDGFKVYPAGPELRLFYNPELCKILDTPQIHSFWFV